MMKYMKKILIIAPLSTLDWGTKNAGGVDSVCQMLVKHLSQTPDEFFYRVLAFDPFSSVNYTGNAIRLSANVEVVVAPSNESVIGIRLPGFLINSIRVKQQISNFKPDIVHSHMSSLLIGVNKKYKRISTLHSYKKIGRKNRSIINNFLYETFFPFLSDFYIDEYTCVGSILHKEILLNSIKPITVIGNPIDDAYFISCEHSHSAPFKMVTCALISRRKRVLELIQIIKAINDKGFNVKLDVIGPYVDIDYKVELQKEIADFNMDDYVSMLGEKCQAEILQIYKKSNYGVFTSAEETFGLAPLEMLASGLPLISSKVGVLEEKSTFFSEIGTCFIEPDDIEGSAVIIMEFIKSKPSVNVERLKTKFSIESVSNKYSGIYKRLSS
jgi:glycosyltransferase involved in cell wall biosynthesis